MHVAAQASGCAKLCPRSRSAGRAIGRASGIESLETVPRAVPVEAFANARERSGAQPLIIGPRLPAGEEALRQGIRQRLDSRLVSFDIAVLTIAIGPDPLADVIIVLEREQISTFAI